MNIDLLNIIVCPCCHAKLEYNQAEQLLICNFENIAYPIKNKIPYLSQEYASPYNLNN